MPEKKKLTTPTRIDRPVLRLSKAKSNGKACTSSKPNTRVNAEIDKKDRPKRKGVARDQKHNKPDAKKPASTNLLSRTITYNILVAVDEDDSLLLPLIDVVDFLLRHLLRHHHLLLQTRDE